MGNNHIETSEDEVKIKVDGKVVAIFMGTHGGDLIEGEVYENYEHLMTSADLIAVAQWLLQKAFERACNEGLE